MMLEMKAEILSLTTGTASANVGVVSLFAKVYLRARAGPDGVSRPPLQARI